MRKIISLFLRDCRAELDEAALVMPLLLLITFGLINLAMVGYAGMAANNAANYGARVASVSQFNQPAMAQSAANSMLDGVTVGTYSVAVLGGGSSGSMVRVQVSFSVPNYFQAIAGLLGIDVPSEFTGSAESDFRQEGW